MCTVPSKLSDGEGYCAAFCLSCGMCICMLLGVATYCRHSCVPLHAEEGLTPYHQPPGADSVGCYGELEHWSENDQALVDGEGRAVLTEHLLSACAKSNRSAECTSRSSRKQSLVVINVYCPRANQDEEQRYEYKMMFYRALELRCRALRQAGRWVVAVHEI